MKRPEPYRGSSPQSTRNTGCHVLMGGKVDGGL